MKYMFLATMYLLFYACGTIGKNGSRSYGTMPTIAPPELILDAYIKAYPKKVHDSLVVRTERIRYRTVEIPFSDSIKFTIKTVRVDTVYLENKKLRKRIFFVNTANAKEVKWSQLKRIK